MRRIHLLELHEQTWCPGPIRDGLTDFLQAAIRGFGLFQPTAPIVAQLVAATGHGHIVDLCSGGSGPWLSLRPLLQRLGTPPFDVLLSDKYPSSAAIERVARRADPGIRYLPTPVDATNVPADLFGLRTIFNCFHQFQPDEARAILQDAATSGRAIGVFEITQRQWLPIILSLGLPGLVLAVAPFTRPFRLSRLFWTWVLPVLPIVVAFDAIVSCLRTYTPDELRAMVEEVDSPGYTWEVGTLPVRFTPFSVTYLTGQPTTAASAEP